MNWTIKAFDELSPLELYQCLRLREQVFFLEQKVDCEDMDDIDLHCLHLYSGDPVNAYCRIIGPEVTGNYVKIGRVVVAKEQRGSGLGKAVMRAAIAECQARWPGTSIKIGAQAYLRRFYEELGFSVCGEEFDEGGIPHYPMLID